MIQNRPTDDELLELYNENVSNYDQPETRFMQYVKWPIISDANDTLRVKLEAENLIYRINNGEDFAQLANMYTEDPSNSANPQELRGGSLGWYSKGQLLPEFEVASFDGKKGDIVGPILTDYGFHVIKINDKRVVDESEQVNTSHILLTITPGRGTENKLRDTASIFALEANEYGFFALADSLGLEINESKPNKKRINFYRRFWRC